MSGLLDFNSALLNSQITKHGVRGAWKNILFTHIRDVSKFGYMLEEPFFDQAKSLEFDFIKGLSIGEIGVLYEYSVAFADSKNRKENGQFFTPDDVAMFMVSLAKSETFDTNGVWLDPCAGIGNLSWHMCAAQADPERFLINNMVLSDRDQLALDIARVLFTVSFQNKHDDLFHRVENSFVALDFLSVYDSSSEIEGSKDWSLPIPTHDYVIVNPPYLATSRDHRFETAESADLYAYFLENICKTSRGFVSVTPQSFTNASKFQSLRRLLLETFPHLTIYCFDNVPGNLFKGFKFGSKNSNKSNSIRAAITVASEGRSKSHRITSLMRWKSEDRAKLLSNAKVFLARVSFSEHFFPKVNSVFKDLFHEMTKPGTQTVGDLLSPDGQYGLYIPSSPRYFISALKSPVDRVSMHLLKFPNIESRDRAYLVLNSSLAYWWWRVKDGGMTLALSTVLSTPVPKFRINPSLVEKLELSEISSKVYKKNAGASRENVKHSRDLISQLNRLVLPLWESKLLLTHENSEFQQLG